MRKGLLPACKKQFGRFARSAALGCWVVQQITVPSCHHPACGGKLSETKGVQYSFVDAATIKMTCLHVQHVCYQVYLIAGLSSSGLKTRLAGTLKDSAILTKSG